VAEFTTLYTVHVAGRTVTTLSSQATGPHHSYALVPIALLAALLAFGAHRAQSRPALVATGALGALALAIALIGDLPDAHAHGVTHSFVLANATPGPGLYLETLGATLLVLSGGLGLAFAPARPPRPGRAARRAEVPGAARAGAPGAAREVPTPSLDVSRRRTH
jgi:hypothetical protein